MSREEYKYTVEDVQKASPTLPILVAIYREGTPYPIYKRDGQYITTGEYVIQKQRTSDGREIWMGCKQGEPCFLAFFGSAGGYQFANKEVTRSWKSYDAMRASLSSLETPLRLAAPRILPDTRDNLDLLTGKRKKPLVTAAAAAAPPLQRDTPPPAVQPQITEDQQMKINMFDTVVANLRVVTDQLERLKGVEAQFEEYKRGTAGESERLTMLLREEIDGLISANAGLKRDLETQRAANAEEVDKIRDDHAARTAALNAKIREREATIAELQSKVSRGCDAELTQLKSSITACNERVVELEQMVDRMDRAGIEMDRDRESLVQQYNSERERFNLELSKVTEAYNKLLGEQRPGDGDAADRLARCADELKSVKQRAETVAQRIDYDAPIGSALFV